MDAKSLYHAAREGDREAFEHLCNSFSKDLRGFITSRMGKDLRRYVEVDDIQQETFATSLEALKKTRWQGERALFSWFCRVAMNTIYANSRRFLRINHLPSDYDGEDEGGVSPSRALRREERFERLEQSLSLLTEDQQQVIRMTRIEGRSVKEVAEEIGKSEKATYQLLWRATKRLGEIFGDTASVHLPPDQHLTPPEQLGE